MPIQLLVIGLLTLSVACSDDEPQISPSPDMDAGDLADMTIAVEDLQDMPAKNALVPRPPQGECWTFDSAAQPDIFWPEHPIGAYIQKKVFTEWHDPETDPHPMNDRRRRRVITDSYLIGHYTFSRYDPEENLVLQIFDIVPKGFEQYANQTSILVNGKPVNATYRRMSLDGERVLDEIIDTGEFYVIDEPYMSLEIEIPSESLPHGQMVDMKILSRFGPINMEPIYQHMITSSTIGFTLYNGGTERPDITIHGKCPNQNGTLTENEDETYEFAIASHRLYVGDDAQKYRWKHIPIPAGTESVDVWHIVEREPGRTFYERFVWSYQLFVNGRPYGAPQIVFPEPHVTYFFRQRFEDIPLDPTRKLNTIVVTAHTNPLHPVASPGGAIYNGKTGSELGTSNALFFEYE